MKISKNIKKKEFKKLKDLDQGAVFKFSISSVDKIFLLTGSFKNKVTVLDLEKFKFYHYEKDLEVIEYEAELKIYGEKEA